MRRRVLAVAALALPAALAPATAASAANVDVRAVDGPPVSDVPDHWSPSSVSISPGDTVTWRFEGTLNAHNVQPAADSPNSWSMPASPVSKNQPPVTWQFTAVGEYRFVCQVHSAMKGSVFVGVPATPVDTGPPAYPNESGAPTVFETGGRDRKRPKVRGLRVGRMARGALVRFRVSERSRVTVRLKRGGRTRARKRVSAAGREIVLVRAPRLKSGRYRVVVRAQDLAGNRSRARVVRARLGSR